MKNYKKLFSLFLFLVAFDQTLKYFLNNLFCNKNLAWSIPVDAGIFYLAWIAIVGFFIYLFIKTKALNQKYLLVFIFSGAVSNLIDRIRFGCVVDYIDIKIWPVFNLADVYIIIGVMLLITSVIKINRPT
ncbi:MAG: hypothetical protein A3J76_06125 [Candidatus Moranbacteria bacterium RBG_13_45_13]|nr:MAG: hypothetical protein A3J76_06125 [Candidatus Moranbacteria bacterium RBG_13_45_13]